MSTTVLLVDDHVLIRSGLREAFDAQVGFTVVGEAAGVQEAIRATRDLAPAVVVIDINLPDGSGLDAVRRLRAEHPLLGVVVLTMYDDDQHLFAALEAGASAFVAKSAAAEEVLAAAGHAAVAPLSFSAANLACAMRRRLDPSRPRLTARESQVLVLLSEGTTVPVIAKRLYISESTAKSYISKLYEKLGAANRSQALLQAIRLGLLLVDSSRADSPPRVPVFPRE